MDIFYIMIGMKRRRKKEDVYYPTAEEIVTTYNVVTPVEKMNGTWLKYIGNN